ncbi:MAG: nitroreductase family protein [Candidatus Ratteibacteria bacterium]
MEFEKLISARYSVRAYKNTPVEEWKIEKILQAARMAPSAANRQPYKIIVIGTKGKESELRKVYDADWFVQAPVVIAICGIKNEAWTRRDGKNHLDVDCAIAMDHMILTATDLGLGTCWICAFNPSEAKKLLRIPEGVDVIALTPVGYPADTPGLKKRKDLKQLVCRDFWQ